VGGKAERHEVVEVAVRLWEMRETESNRANEVVSHISPFEKRPVE
jgi:hypothetical protein